jgi:MFS family permease
LESGVIFLENNIRIIYLLAALRNPWFWLGIWVFYYLRFTNYTGIGVIETILFFTVFIMEIPTGAVADLFGKKRTLIFGFFLQGVCNLLMAYTPNVYGLMLAVFLGGVGMTCISGTLDALLFDSLKNKKRIFFPTNIRQGECTSTDNSCSSEYYWGVSLHD